MNSTAELLEALKAAGEPTRLRMVAVLADSELTVSELCRVLGQSQPRVSRHLRLLCEAGLLDRHAQGTHAYYRPARRGTGRQLLDALVPLLSVDDEQVARDRSRLGDIRAERAEAAAEYFERIADDWDGMRKLHVADAEVEAAMTASLDQHTDGGGRVEDLLDIGTGTGRVLELFADRIGHGLGIDLSKQMLNLARSRLEAQGLLHCAVRQGNVYDLDVDSGSIDVAVLHHVLHFLDDPARAIAEAARTLRPGGQLMIVDFGPHTHEHVRTDFAHRWLGFADEEIAGWSLDAGLLDSHITHLENETMTVTLWVSTQHASAPAVYSLEAAS